MSDASAGYSVRRAALERDLDAILRIDAETFTNPVTRESYESEARYSDVARLWVVCADGTPAPATGGDVIGYCAAWLILDELHINNLAVHPEWRRRGAASYLLKAVLAEAESGGAYRATLEVRRSNEAALRLYEGVGFHVAGVRSAYYRAPVEDALILWRGPSGGAGSGT